MEQSELPPDLSEIAERIGAVAAEAATVVVGLGILGLNRVQVLRRDLLAKLAEEAGREGQDPADHSE